MTDSRADEDVQYLGCVKVNDLVVHGTTVLKMSVLGGSGYRVHRTSLLPRTAACESTVISIKSLVLQTYKKSLQTKNISKQANASNIL